MFVVVEVAVGHISVQLFFHFPYIDELLFYLFLALLELIH